MCNCSHSQSCECLYVDTHTSVSYVHVHACTFYIHAHHGKLEQQDTESSREIVRGIAMFPHAAVSDSVWKLSLNLSGAKTVLNRPSRSGGCEPDTWACS